MERVRHMVARIVNPWHKIYLVILRNESLRDYRLAHLAQQENAHLSGMDPAHGHKIENRTSKAPDCLKRMKSIQRTYQRADPMFQLNRGRPNFRDRIDFGIDGIVAYFTRILCF
jgi:hypothetical protein